jgi:hypothetical protein
MRPAGTDAVGALRWGLRRYFWLVLACVALGAVVAPRAEAGLERPVEAEALVVANRLDMELTALPRYGEAVFDNGAVAAAVAAKYPELSPIEDIVPNRVSLVAEQDSIVLRVIGHHVDPTIAADLANTATAAFVPALNVTGVGAGAFTLQSPASPPPAPDEGLSRRLALPVGLVAGFVLALALVSLILVIRRPVIAPEDAEDVTGVPALGTVKVPWTRQGQLAPPDAFPGLVPVCRRLLHLSTPTIVLVSRHRDERARRQLTAALARVLSKVRDVRLIGRTMPELPGIRSIGSIELESTVGELESAAGKEIGPVADRVSSNGRGRLSLVDSSEPLDLVQPPRLTAAVLVVPVGIRRAALSAAVAEHLGGSAEARLLLIRRGGWSLTPGPRAGTATEVVPEKPTVFAGRAESPRRRPVRTFARRLAGGQPDSTASSRSASPSR